MLPFPIAGDYHLPTKLSFKGLGKMEKVENRWQLLVIWLVASESVRNDESKIGSQSQILPVVREAEMA